LKSGVRAFALRVAGLVGASPPGFFTLFESEILKSLCAYVQEEKTQNDFSVQLAYAEMLSSVAVHSSGWHWIIESGKLISNITYTKLIVF
jgi:hypothetical protein